MVIRNSITGKQFEVSDFSLNSRSLYKFGRTCTALDRWAALHGKVLYWFTLTQAVADSGVTNDRLHKLYAWLGQRFSRAGESFRYLWAVDVQWGRLKNRGERVLHWHDVVACSEGALPDCSYKYPKSHRGMFVRADGGVISFADLHDRWGLGIVMCELVRSRFGVFNYLRRYLVKDYGEFKEVLPEWGSLRRFGSSHFGVESWPEWAYEWVRPYLAGEGLYFVRKGGRVMVCEHDAEGGLRVLASARSPWSIVPCPHRRGVYNA